MEQLNLKHFEVVSEYIEQAKVGIAKHYMMTIARDGESPARSIYFYDNAVEAANGFAAYTDWGFAKDYLTVVLYEPTGKKNEKVLKRPRGGECTFVKNDYLAITDALSTAKPDISEEVFDKLILEVAKIFSRDNQRFNHERFLHNLGYTGEINNDIRY
jgi:hypothetical protein